MSTKHLLRNYLSYTQRYYKEVWKFSCSNKNLIRFSTVIFIEMFVFYIVNGTANDHYRVYVESAQDLYPNELVFIFCENLKSAAGMILVGLVPLFFGGLYGAMMAVSGLVVTLKYELQSLPFRTIFLSLLPHGIFEMTVLVFSYILSNILSEEITLGLWRRITGKTVSFWGRPSPLFGIKKTGVFILSSMVFVIVPLLFLAATIEVTISPMVLSVLM